MLFFSLELTKGDYFPEKGSKRPPGIAKNKACCIYYVNQTRLVTLQSNISLSYKLCSPLSSLRSSQKKFTPTPSPPYECYVMKSEKKCKYLTACMYTRHSLLSWPETIFYIHFFSFCVRNSICFPSEVFSS